MSLHIAGVLLNAITIPLTHLQCFKMHPEEVAGAGTPPLPAVTTLTCCAASFGH